VALFPQFVRPGEPVLPLALGMAGAIVLFDWVWFSALAFAVDRARTILRLHVQRRLERLSGAVMVGFGLKLATEAR
jgi:threonine/homoserine/homoserine lactone efflux protein